MAGHAAHNGSELEKLYLAVSLKECELGQEFDHLPPHLTIVPPFHLQAQSRPKLNELMAEVLEENPGVLLVGGRLRDYGLDGETKVREVGGYMFGLHAASLALVKALGGEFDEQYTGLEWAPHISYNAAIDEGQRIKADKAQLFKYLPHAKRVKSIYSAKESYFEED